MKLTTGSEKTVNNNRIQVGQVAKYCQDYVAKMGLQDKFRNHSEVTSVKEITELSSSHCKGERLPEIRKKSVPDLRREENAIFGNESLYDSESECCSCSVCSSSSSNGSSGSSPDSGLGTRASLSNTCTGLWLQNRYRRNLQLQLDYDECSARDEDMEEMASNIDLCCSWNPICNPMLFSGNYRLIKYL